MFGDFFGSDNAFTMASIFAFGKGDPFKATGMAFGAKGDLSDSDMAELGAALGTSGVFDDDDDDEDNDEDE